MNESTTELVAKEIALYNIAASRHQAISANHTLDSIRSSLSLLPRSDVLHLQGLYPEWNFERIASLGLLNLIQQKRSLVLNFATSTVRAILFMEKRPPSALFFTSISEALQIRIEMNVDPLRPPMDYTSLLNRQSNGKRLWIDLSSPSSDATWPLLPVVSIARYYFGAMEDAVPPNISLRRKLAHLLTLEAGQYRELLTSALNNESQPEDNEEDSATLSVELDNVPLEDADPESPDQTEWLVEVKAEEEHEDLFKSLIKILLGRKKRARKYRVKRAESSQGSELNTISSFEFLFIYFFVRQRDPS